MQRRQCCVDGGTRGAGDSIREAAAALAGWARLSQQIRSRYFIGASPAIVEVVRPDVEARARSFDTLGELHDAVTAIGGHLVSIQNHPLLQQLMGGLAFPESPRWHDGRLLVSDWGAGEVIAAGLDGRTEVVAKIESFPMCIDHLPDGRLLIVASSERRILRREPDGALVTHADLKDFGEYPWNDVVVDGRGNAYVNNIGFDFPDGEVAPGTIVLVTPSGSVRQAAEGVLFPNGMVVTPDNATLIVAESYGSKLTAFEIAADGSLSNARTWAEVEDHPDGICLDADGAIWYGDVGTSRAVRVREGGEVLQTIELDWGCFATMLGGPARRTLFLVANEWGGPSAAGDASAKGQVLTVPAPAPGVGWP